MGAITRHSDGWWFEFRDGSGKRFGRVRKNREDAEKLNADLRALLADPGKCDDGSEVKRFDGTSRWFLTVIAKDVYDMHEAGSPEARADARANLRAMGGCHKAVLEFLNDGSKEKELEELRGMVEEILHAKKHSELKPVITYAPGSTGPHTGPEKTASGN